MAALADAVATADTGNTPNTTGSFTPVAGDLLVCIVVCSDSVTETTVPTASANGITFTHVRSQAMRTSLDRLNVYVANQLVPASPVAMTVTYTPGDAGTGTCIWVKRITGMTNTGSAAIRGSAGSSNQTGTGTPAVTLPAAALTGNPLIGVIGVAVPTANPYCTPPTSWTRPAGNPGQLSYTTPTTSAEYYFRDSGHTSATITWGSAIVGNSGWNVLAVEFDASGGAPQVTIEGALDAIGELAGNVVRDRAVAGGLDAIGELAGAAAVARTIAGALEGIGELAGDVTVTPGGPGGQVTIEGALEGIGELSGDVVRNRGITGALEGIGELAGAAVRDRGVAGGLDGIGELAGAAATGRTIQGALEGIGELAGAAVRARAVAGALEAIGELAGDISIAGQVTIIGALDAIGELAAVATVTRPVAGALDAIGELAGTPTRERAAAGAVDGIGELVGAVVRAVAIAGALEGIGELSGEAVRARAIAGALEAIGELGGDVTVTGEGFYEPRTLELTGASAPAVLAAVAEHRTLSAVPERLTLNVTKD
jgi:hypothetical protein